jgi:hypothetical protein
VGRAHLVLRSREWAAAEARAGFGVIGDEGDAEDALAGCQGQAVRGGVDPAAAGRRLELLFFSANTRTPG